MRQDGCTVEGGGWGASGGVSVSATSFRRSSSEPPSNWRGGWVMGERGRREGGWEGGREGGKGGRVGGGEGEEGEKDRRGGGGVKERIK